MSDLRNTVWDTDDSPAGSSESAASLNFLDILPAMPSQTSRLSSDSTPTLPVQPSESNQTLQATLPADQAFSMTPLADGGFSTREVGPDGRVESSDIAPANQPESSDSALSHRLDQTPLPGGGDLLEMGPGWQMIYPDGVYGQNQRRIDIQADKNENGDSTFRMSPDSMERHGFQSLPLSNGSTHYYSDGLSMSVTVHPQLGVVRSQRGTDVWSREL